MTYQDFSEKIRSALQDAKQPMTWTEVRTAAGLPQLFPNNQWVHRMEQDIGLSRHRDHNGIIRWHLGGGEGEKDDASNTPAPAAKPERTRADRKKGPLE